MHRAQLLGIPRVRFPGAAGPGCGDRICSGLGLRPGSVSARDPQMPVPWNTEPQGWGWKSCLLPAPVCPLVLSLVAVPQVPSRPPPSPLPPAPQAFTSGLRRYLQYYRACVLSTPPTLSLLTIAFLFKKLGRQLR